MHHHDDTSPDRSRSASTERHRARQAMRQANHLRSGELESGAADEILDQVEPVNGRSMHSANHRSTPTSHPKGALEPTASGVGKVWKLKFWKRRTAKRHQVPLHSAE